MGDYVDGEEGVAGKKEEEEEEEDTMNSSIRTQKGPPRHSSPSQGNELDSQVTPSDRRCRSLHANLPTKKTKLFEVVRVRRG